MKLEDIAKELYAGFEELYNRNRNFILIRLREIQQEEGFTLQELNTWANWSEDSTLVFDRINEVSTDIEFCGYDHSQKIYEFNIWLNGVIISTYDVKGNTVYDEHLEHEYDDISLADNSEVGRATDLVEEYIGR